MQTKERNGGGRSGQRRHALRRRDDMLPSVGPRRAPRPNILNPPTNFLSTFCFHIPVADFGLSMRIDEHATHISNACQGTITHMVRFASRGAAGQLGFGNQQSIDQLLACDLGLCAPGRLRSRVPLISPSYALPSLLSPFKFP